MLNLKNNPVAKDVYIQSLQKFLYKKLKGVWPVDDTNINGYGRAYRNANDVGYVPEFFISSTDPNNTIYEQIKFDKELNRAIFFFDADDKEVYKEGTSMVNVFLIFIVNVDLLYPDIAHRGDEEARNEVRKLCSIGLYNMMMKGEETGFKNVFKRFDGLVNKDGEVFEDRHPLYCFKMNFELMYNPAEIKC